MVDELYGYWADRPPVHEVAYALFRGLGGGAPAKASNMPAPPPSEKLNSGNLLAELGGVGGGRRAKITIPPPPVNNAR